MRILSTRRLMMLPADCQRDHAGRWSEAHVMSGGGVVVVSRYGRILFVPGSACHFRMLRTVIGNRFGITDEMVHWQSSTHRPTCYTLDTFMYRMVPILQVPVFIRHTSK